MTDSIAVSDESRRLVDMIVDNPYNDAAQAALLAHIASIEGQLVQKCADFSMLCKAHDKLEIALDEAQTRKGLYITLAESAIDIANAKIIVALRSELAEARKDTDILELHNVALRAVYDAVEVQQFHSDAPVPHRIQDAYERAATWLGVDTGKTK